MNDGVLAEVFIQPSPKEMRRRRKGNPEEIERERKYICARETIEQTLEAASERHQHIVQSYFPKSFGQFLIPLAVELKLITPEFRNLQVTQARLRMTEESSSTQYSLAVKGRLPGLLATERVELPIALQKDTYDALMPHAEGGTITKDRFVCPIGEGEFCQGDASQPAEETLLLEIDIPDKRYGKGAEGESLRKLKLAFLEIEIASRAVDRALRKGIHDIKLLHLSMDISKDQEEHERFRKLLSWSRLARKGLSDSKLQKALPELHEKLT